MGQQRIEYIDAMRGLTMILVVYSHVCNYCLGDRLMAWNDVFFLFRLPCFFFISGWLFERVGRVWDCTTIRETVCHKLMVQIVPTVIFLLILAPPPLFFSRLGATKGGYWFTFALFEFFLLAIFSGRWLKRWQGVFALLISVAAFCYDIFYNSYFKNMGLLTDFLGFLSFMTWRYYLFFYIGMWVKRHFEQFILFTSRPLVVILTIAGFVVIARLPHTGNPLCEYLIFACGGILGMTMVFTYFRTFASSFSRQRRIGRVLQYIGTRTLDVYLLHYFFLPRFLLGWGMQLRAFDCKPLELLLALLLSVLVVVACLSVSWLIRLNPFLGHYLLGVKYEKQG